MYPTTHIYLSGIMGSGKTTVGRLVSQKIGLPFLDTDELLEAQLVQPISKIFQTRGEAFFRVEEKHLLTTIRGLPPRVVSLGGGVVLSPSNREILRHGCWINLKAHPSVILDRIGSKKTRPLLGRGRGQREGLDDLLRQRRAYYEMAPYQIDAGSLALEAVAGEIIKIWRTS